MPSSRRSFLLRWAAAGLFAPAVLAQASRERVYWSGRSGGYRWRFTSRDLTASAAGRSFSLRKALFPRGRDMEGLTFYSSTATPLSPVSNAPRRAGASGREMSRIVMPPSLVLWL